VGNGEYFDLRGDEVLGGGGEEENCKMRSCMIFILYQV
jgi:hypothetical protein